MKKTILLITSLLLLSTSFGLARNGRAINYYGPKKAGMGGCGVAVIDKRESLYYNPASIVDIDNAVIIPVIQSSSQVGIDMVSNLQKLAEAADEVNQNDDTSKAIDIYRKLIPTRLGYGFSSGGHIIGTTGLGLEKVASHFAIGTYTNFKLGANMLNRLSPRLEAIGFADVIGPTITFARAFDVTQNSFIQNPKLGITVKNINRYSLYNAHNGSETFVVEVLDLISKDTDVALNVRAGQGVGVDLGFIGDIETFMGPGKMGFSLVNISTVLTGKQYSDVTSEDGKEISNYREEIPVVGTLGFAIKASLFESSGGFLDNLFPDTTYAIDLDIVSPETSTYKKIHLGLEQTYFNDLMAWRLGINQGYPTTGFNFNFGVYHVGLTYYTEEFGREIGENPQSFYVLDGGFYW